MVENTTLKGTRIGTKIATLALCSASFPLLRPLWPCYHELYNHLKRKTPIERAFKLSQNYMYDINAQHSTVGYKWWLLLSPLGIRLWVHAHTMCTQVTMFQLTSFTCCLTPINFSDSAALGVQYNIEANTDTPMHKHTLTHIIAHTKTHT